MTKNKYATVDFDQVNEKGLKSLIAAINKTGVTVIEVDSSNRATTKDGVKVKTAKLVLNDGQILAIQVNDTGDISSVRLNGKAIPNAQSPDIKTLGTVMGQAARKNSAKFQKSLIAKAKRVANPVDKKPAVKSNFQRLQKQNSGMLRWLPLISPRRIRCLSINSRSLICGRSWIRRRADSITKRHGMANSNVVLSN